MVARLSRGSYGRLRGLWHLAAIEPAQDRARFYIFRRVFFARAATHFARKTPHGDGSIMHRTLAIATAALSLGGCSSFSLDAFKPGPPTVQVQLESTPPGADALTSLGPGCKTPCSVAVTVPDAGFSVTYTLNRFQPITVPVELVHGDLSTPASVTPNPVVAELQPAGPPPRAVRKRAVKPRRPRPPRAAPAPAAASPFPEQEQAPAAAPTPAASPPPPAGH
jgi:hypothetical protein